MIVMWLRAVAAQHGLQVRIPLLDPALTDLAVAVPPSLHRRQGVEKPLLRAAFEDDLGPLWRHRTKADQPFVEGGLATELSRHRDAWSARLRGGHLETMDLVPRRAQEEVLDEAGRGGAVLPLYRALSMVTLEIWCEAQGLAD